MSTTAWLIGSNPSIGEVTITIDATGSDPEELSVIPAIFAPQPQYLYSPNNFGAVESLMNAIRDYSAVDLSESDVYLTRDRKVRIDFEGGGGAETVEIDSWGGAGADAFQEMLGFTGSELIGSFSTFTAPETSPYLWSPNKTETPGPGLLGKDGAPYFDTAVGMSAAGRRVYATTHNSGALNDFTFQRVLSERYWTEAEEWGEYFVWWNFVQRNFYKFKLWRNVNELDGSTEAATIGDDLGPYVYRPESFPITFPMARDAAGGSGMAEFLYTVHIPVVVVDEYE